MLSCFLCPISFYCLQVQLDSELNLKNSRHSLHLMHIQHVIRSEGVLFLEISVHKTVKWMIKKIKS